MPIHNLEHDHIMSVRGTEIAATDTPQHYRQKLARIALDEMYQFVAVLDAGGTLLEVNRAALEGGGLQLSDVEGKPFWKCFWWGVSVETQETLKGAIARAAKGEFIRYDVEVYGRAGGKETIIIDFSMIPVKDNNGKVVFIVPEGRDITEKKAYELEVAQKNADLQSLLERIRELDEVKTQFFANVSHELRTPLALILGPAERLANPDLRMNDDERHDTGQVIARNAKMLLKHVNDLLDLSKLEAGKVKLELRETDVVALTKLIASHFEVLAAERQVNYIVDTMPSYYSAVDPEKLQRILMNLLSNAFKFVPLSGTVRCSLKASGKGLILALEDSGPGVRPELREVIFERFRQGDGGVNRQFSGTGLGLAIAHEFVEMHNGKIEVLDSILGGAMFQVSLPAFRLSGPVGEGSLQASTLIDRGSLNGIIEELRMPAPGVTSDETGTQGKATILVVEDNPDMNRFIVQCLSKEYHVITAYDGGQGIDKALAYNPALIVSDIMMPGVSGVQMITELRRRPEMNETPILLLSAKADEELKIQLLEASAQDFITKPFSERDLLVRVRNLIAVRQSREVLREVEQRRRQEVEAVNRELQERSRHLSDLFEQTPSFMAVLRGPTHVFEFANAAYLRLVGRREIVGKSVCDALPEIKEQGFIDLLDRVRATGEPFTGTHIPVLVQRVPGAPLEQRFVNFVFQPLIEKNKDAGIFVEGHDVTDQKRAEDSLRVANRRKDEFLATLAHELRNPLAPIRHAAKLSKNKDATKAELEWSHDVVDRQVGHMARLLDDLLDVSRITGGKLEMRKERLVLNEILMAAVETVRPLIEARGHSLTMYLPKINVFIDADPVRFEQILSNLLTNSAKYTDRGGIIHIQVTLENGTVQIVVRDNGIGISPELLPHLFDMFSQATPAIDRSEGGLGIGLSLVRGLVLLHGGTVEARSQGIGQGSEFIITFPVASVARAHAVAPPASSNADNDADRRMRVLVIDDNRDNADLCSMMFRKAGHEVRTAYTGQEGLDIAAEFVPQFVLLDIGMPQMNGFEVARRIRAAKWGEKITLIAITGWGQEDDKQKARAAGFDHHVTKPFDFKELKKLLMEKHMDTSNL